METKISLVRSLDNKLVKSIFETYIQFKNRVEEIQAVTIGNALLDIESYDRDSGVCFVNVDFFSWKAVEEINYDYYYFIMPNKEKKLIESLDGTYKLLSKFKVMGEKVYIDTESLMLIIDDLELKLYPISLKQDLFEADEQFQQRIKNIRTMPIGKINIDKIDYDINTSSFKFDVEINTLEEIKVPNIKGLFCFIDKETAEDFYVKSKNGVLYGNFYCLKNEIAVNVDSFHIIYNGKKIKVYTILLDKIYFTQDGFTEQIEMLSKLASGKATLLVEKYDKVGEVLPIHIKWDNWIKEYTSTLTELHIDADLMLAKNIFSGGLEYPVYVHLVADKETFNVEKIEIKNYIGDIEVKFNDIYGSINNGLDEECATLSNVLNYEDKEEMNNCIDEKFDFVNGIALVKVNGKYTYINEHGEILGILNKRLMRFINNKGKYGYMDNIDRVILINPEYDYIGNFYEGFAKVNIRNKWGYINEQGEVVIEMQFDFAKDFNEGYAAIKMKSLLGPKWGYINREGKIVISPKYDEASEFSNGFAYVKIKGLFKGEREGFISENGEFHDYVRDANGA